MIQGRPTNKGDALALKLAEAIGTTGEIRVICALLCRHATTLHRLNEDECNGHPAMGDPRTPVELASKLQERWEARVEKGQERAIRRMNELVGHLPDKWTLKPEDDPRGCSVLVYEGELPFRGDSWGERRGACIPR